MAKTAARIALALSCLAVPIARAGVPKTISDYFHTFLETKWNRSPYETDQEMDGWTLDADDRNGFLEASDNADLENNIKHYTFAVWRRKGSRPGKVFGYTEGTQDCVAETSFWAYEQGKWRKLESLAPIGLKDFLAEGKTLPKGSERYVALDFRLPRRGTTITVGLKPRCENGVAPFDLEPFEKWMGEARYRTVQLTWDAEAGRFTKGAKTAVEKR